MKVFQKGIHRIWLLVAAAAIAEPSLAGAPSPSACNPYDGKLKNSTPNVAFDSQHFYHAGNEYPINIFSLANSAPWAPNFICRRYEVENIGDAPIALFGQV
jgi:hypothetical protein